VFSVCWYKLFESYWQSILVVLAEPKQYSAAAFRMSWKGYEEDVGRFISSEVQ
jgi:hypothetical protein